MISPRDLLKGHRDHVYNFKGGGDSKLQSLRVEFDKMSKVCHLQHNNYSNVMAKNFLKNRLWFPYNLVYNPFPRNVPFIVYIKHTVICNLLPIVVSVIYLRIKALKGLTNTFL